MFGYIKWSFSNAHWHFSSQCGTRIGCCHFFVCLVQIRSKSIFTNLSFSLANRAQVCFSILFLSSFSSFQQRCPALHWTLSDHSSSSSDSFFSSVCASKHCGSAKITTINSKIIFTILQWRCGNWCPHLRPDTDGC